MLEQSKNEFTYPGTEKWKNQGSYGGFNYTFKSGWTISISDGGNDLARLCYVGYHGRIFDINQIMGRGELDDYDDKRYLNRGEIEELFKRVSELGEPGAGF